MIFIMRSTVSLIIWSLSKHKKDFFCIEPVMRDAGGIVEDPEKIKPKETFMARVNFKLKTMS